MRSAASPTGIHQCPGNLRERAAPRRDWTRSVEVGLTNSSRPLRIFSAADMSASLLAAMQAMDAGEEMVMQWVVTPAVPRHKPVYKQAHSDTRACAT